MERPENARWERLLSIARDTMDNRPVLTSEYAHAMGNALGNFQEYWDEIYSHPRMLGGFIWEWADEGIEAQQPLPQPLPREGSSKSLPSGRLEGVPFIAYGGDFNDYPNLKAFCIKGIVDSYRNTTPKYEEVKQVYAPIWFQMNNGRVEVKKHDPHFDLSTITVKEEKRNGYRYVTASLKDATSWAPKGHVIARSQFADATAPKAKSPKLKEKILHSSLFTLHFSLSMLSAPPPTTIRVSATG